MRSILDEVFIRRASYISYLSAAMLCLNARRSLDKSSIMEFSVIAIRVPASSTSEIASSVRDAPSRLSGASSVELTEVALSAFTDKVSKGLLSSVSRTFISVNGVRSHGQVEFVWWQILLQDLVQIMKKKHLLSIKIKLPRRSYTLWPT